MNKFTSLIGVTGIFSFILSLMVFFLVKLKRSELAEYHSNFLYPKGNIFEIVSLTPSLVVAILFQYLVFPIYHSLKEKSNQNVIKASNIAITICAIIYIITGISGYLLFGNALNDSILDNLLLELRSAQDQDLLIQTILFFIVIGILIGSCMTIPLTFYSLQKHFINTLTFYRKKFVFYEKLKEDKMLRECINKTRNDEMLEVKNTHLLNTNYANIKQCNSSINNEKCKINNVIQDNNKDANKLSDSSNLEESLIKNDQNVIEVNMRSIDIRNISNKVKQELAETIEAKYISKKEKKYM